MTDNIIAQGFKNDRYRKTCQLKSVFEEEIEQYLNDQLSTFVSECDTVNWADHNSDPDHSRGSSSSNEKRFMRSERDIDLETIDNGDSKPKLNLRIAWKDPARLPDIDSDSSCVTYIGYKIKNDQDDGFNKGAQLTAEERFSDVYTDSDANSAGGVFYYQFEDDKGLETGLEHLREHFNKYVSALEATAQ